MLHSFVQVYSNDTWVGIKRKLTKTLPLLEFVTTFPGSKCHCKTKIALKMGFVHFFFRSEINVGTISLLN